MIRDELEALHQLALLGLALRLALVVLLAWLLAVALPLALRIAWQLGSDPRRRLARVRTASRLAAPPLVVFGMLLPVVERAPLLGSIGAATLAGLALLAAPQGARNLAAGLASLVRGHPRIGERVRIGELEGVVDDVLLTRIVLRTREGGLTWVPSAEFAGKPFTLGSRGAAVPLELVLDDASGLDELALERIRRALWFSPLRRAGSEVVLAREGTRLRVGLDTWVARVEPEHLRHVQALLQRARTHESNEAPREEDEA